MRPAVATVCHSLACIAHAPSVPGVGPEVRRVRGCLLGNPGAMTPRETRASLPESLVEGLPGTSRSRGCLSAPAPAICVPGHNFGFRRPLTVAGACAIAP